MRPRFTLSHFVVLAALVVVLLCTLSTLFIYTDGRSRTTKTIGLIKTLHDGCIQYRSFEMFKKFPEHDGGNSKPLHRCLGSQWLFVG